MSEYICEGGLGPSPHSLLLFLNAMHEDQSGMLAAFSKTSVALQSNFLTKD